MGAFVTPLTRVTVQRALRTKQGSVWVRNYCREGSINRIYDRKVKHVISQAKPLCTAIVDLQLRVK